MTPYPNSEDYVRAVQRPAETFRTPLLRRAVLETHPLFGIPMPASGNAAVVFKATIDGTPNALRFFIREDASSRERYGALGRHFRTHDLMDCVAGPVWIDDAIELNGRTWPMVQMEWVEGRTLDAYVGHLAERGDVTALGMLAQSWRDGVARLQAAEFAHGDLQHGNVLVDTSSALRLVDFDGSWIGAFRGDKPPNEQGHPNYQRTGRTWGRWMDTFPALVIYTGLLALSRRPDAWAALHNGENMLFSHDDFAPPFTTPAWRFVTGIGDPETTHAVGLLQRCCEPGWSATGTLDDLLTRERVVVPGPRPAPRVEADDPDLPWWMKTAPVVAGSSFAPPHPVSGEAPTRPFPPSPVGAMPPPPPKIGPQPGRPSEHVFVPAPAEPWFGHAPADPPPATPKAPRVPIPKPAPASGGGGTHPALIATAVALVTGLLVAGVVSANDGDALLGFLLSGVVAFLLTFVIAKQQSR